MSTSGGMRISAVKVYGRTLLVLRAIGAVSNFTHKKRYVTLVWRKIKHECSKTRLVSTSRIQLQRRSEINLIGKYTWVNLI